jgi:hypothetical protein
VALDEQRRAAEADEGDRADRRVLAVLAYPCGQGD